MEVFYPEDGQLADLGGMVGDRQILLVTGELFFELCGAAKILTPVLERHGYSRFSNYSPNPTLQSFGRLHSEVRSAGLERYSAILAVGGGTSIDLAKLIKVFAPLEKISAADLQKPLGEIWEIPLLAVPTTAGSGSEATHFAVVYDGHDKHSVADQRLRPDGVFIEPELLRTLPREEAAAGALDAFCQAVESYWSIHATTVSREIAAGAARLAWQAMVPFVLGRDPESMAAMARAAHLAGRAIDLTKTTAPHAVSYPLTSRYGVRHGHAVALMLAALLPFNAGAGSSVVAQACGFFGVGEGDSGGAAGALRSRVEDLGLRVDLPALGLSTERDLEFVLDHGFNPGRVGNNPRHLSREVLKGILRPLIVK